jgi:hypothetical protein
MLDTGVCAVNNKSNDGEATYASLQDLSYFARLSSSRLRGWGIVNAISCVNWAKEKCEQ